MSMFNVIVDPDRCASNPCANGGTCTNSVSHFCCDCAAGFTGDTCDEGMILLQVNPSTDAQ